MYKTIVFNHIPRTGGTTLRIILNKVYGEKNVFFIKSKDISSSLDYFRSLAEKNRSAYKIISGHGANLFLPYVKDAFRITVLREPVSTFISQYFYLRKSTNSNFLEEVRSLSFDDYINYAIENNQDNILTRFMNKDHSWLLDDNRIKKSVNGEMLVKAKSELDKYDAVLDLSNFDSGIYSLSELLRWQKIPLYRKSNSSDRKGELKVTNETIVRLKEMLKFDIELYNHFMESDLNLANKRHSSLIFKLRQSVINKLF